VAAKAVEILIRRRCSRHHGQRQNRTGITNDTDWSAVQPLVQKVLDARRDVGVGGGMRALFGRNRGGNNNNGGGNNPVAVDSAANPARSRMPCKKHWMTMRRPRRSRTCSPNTRLQRSQTGQARSRPGRPEEGPD